MPTKCAESFPYVVELGPEMRFTIESAEAELDTVFFFEDWAGHGLRVGVLVDVITFWDDGKMYVDYTYLAAVLSGDTVLANVGGVVEDAYAVLDVLPAIRTGICIGIAAHAKLIEGDVV